MDSNTHNPSASILDIKQQIAAKGFSINQAGAGNNQPQDLLKSGVRPLDQFFAGGLPFGHLLEMGMPHAKGGRISLVPFLAQAARRELWCLWAYALEGVNLFAPAFLGRGVSPDKMFFSSSKFPIEELKSLLLHPLFKVIILDSPLKLKREDLGFLATQARAQKKLIIVIRPYFLSNKLGNIWAHWRVNIWQNPRTQDFVFRPVRGLGAKDLRLEERCLR